MKIAYHSFAGRYSDSPRALHEALLARDTGDTHVWLADPAHLHAFPPDTATVWDTAAWVEALESADLVIANTHTEVDWSKRPGAVYLQTWHGTPLKRIHRDVLWAPPGRLDYLDEDVARWDVLLSPNRISTPLLRAAFRFDGEVLESGYPRNDLLTDPARDRIRAKVRAELGIPDGVRAVLYTPTWRDDAYYLPGQPDVPLGLDVPDVAQQLGEDYVLLLRLHNFVTDRHPTVRAAGVRDVSYYPDVRDLYLAADVMVTDYSSTMFDFAVTGKPMLFYAYDLADYRDRLRGFYLDLEAEAPGPVYTAAEDLLAGLRDVDSLAARYAESYAGFRDRYCHLEDGHATERVLQRFYPSRS